jgi:hypothetical protein
MRQLISKLIAAAISAAVVLLWWPIIMSSNGPTSWALRAVAWTLLFELVLALLAPIEESIWDNFLSARRWVARLAHARQRLYARDGNRVRHVASSVAVLAVVGAIPLALVAGGPAPAKPATTVVKERGKTKIVRITKVIEVTAGGSSTVVRPLQSKPATGGSNRKTTAQHKTVSKQQTKTKQPAAVVPPEPTAPAATPAPDPAASSGTG